MVLKRIAYLDFVCFKRKVGRCRSQGPDLDGSVQTSRGKGIRILGIDGDGFRPMVSFIGNWSGTLDYSHMT
jgi:hypothetical protein